MSISKDNQTEKSVWRKGKYQKRIYDTKIYWKFPDELSQLFILYKKEFKTLNLMQYKTLIC